MRCKVGDVCYPDGHGNYTKGCRPADNHDLVVFKENDKKICYKYEDSKERPKCFDIANEKRENSSVEISGYLVIYPVKITVGDYYLDINHPLEKFRLKTDCKLP